MMEIKEIEPEDFTVVDEMPQFPGGGKGNVFVYEKNIYSCICVKK